MKFNFRGYGDHEQPAFRNEYSALYVLRSYCPCPMAVFTATMTNEMLKKTLESLCIDASNLEHVTQPPNRYVFALID